MNARISLGDLHRRVAEGGKLTMLTAYDATSARLAEAAGIDFLLVGDSLGMVMQGNDTTLDVTVDDVCYHSRSVARATQRAFIVADLPFASYGHRDQALAHAARLLSEGKAHSVKLEGGAHVCDQVRHLVNFGIPVMGHVGFTPQSQMTLGIKVQAKTAHSAAALMDDCLALQAAGAWAIVLELIPANLAQAVTEELDIPTIGIGAGPHCDGQVQVWPDILGLDPTFVPRHTRAFCDGFTMITTALRDYRMAVSEGSFPSIAQAKSVDESVITAARVLRGKDS